MKLSVAQIHPVNGDIEANIGKHKTLIDAALSKRADAIIFPELSLTGYEPTLAKQLARDPNDITFSDFQRIADEKELVIGVGVPTRTRGGCCISMILFEPHRVRRIYSKKYLHRDEEEFFITADNFSVFKIRDADIAPAICYEISVPEHAERAVANGADIYVASVNKSVAAIHTALGRLAEVARTYSMTVLMSNCVGFCDRSACAGKTSIWNDKGLLVGQLDDRSEGILIIDTVTREVVKRRIN